MGSAAGRCRAGDSTRSRLILTQPLKDKYFPSLGFEDRWFVWEVIAEDTGGGRESEKEGKGVQREVPHGFPPWATGAQFLGSSEVSGEHTSEPSHLRGAGVFRHWALGPAVCVGRESPPGKELQVPAGGRGPHHGDTQGRGAVGGALVGGLLRCLPPVTDEDAETQWLSKLP